MDSDQGGEQKTPFPLGRAALGFTYVFLVMSSYYILKPVRASFFLEHQTYRNVPRVHVMVLVVTFFAFQVYKFAAHRLGPARLVTATNGFFLCCIGFFWVSLTQYGYIEGLKATMAWVYFCWVSVFAGFSVTLFWSLIHTVFSTDEGAKSYGLIGAGATCGAMTGGGLTSVLAEPITTPNLLLVALVILSPCLVLGSVLARMARDPQVGGLTDLDAANKPAVSRRSTLLIFRQSRYLCVIGSIVFLWVLIMVLEEYRHFQVIDTSSVQGDSRTALLGQIYLFGNLGGLFLGIVVTGPVLSRFGPLPGLLMFAGLIIAAGAAYWFAPGLQVVLWSWIAYQAVGYSIGQWSRELLYTRTSTEEKFIAKGFIDTFLFRAGAGAAALGLIAAAAIGPDSDGLLTHAVTQLSFLTIPLGLLLAILAWWISRRFHQLAHQQNL